MVATGAAGGMILTSVGIALKMYPLLIRTKEIDRTKRNFNLIE
jgi:hypothetical protein